MRQDRALSQTRKGLCLVWLWGVRGLLPAIAIIGIVKGVSQHINELQPVTECCENEGVTPHHVV